MDKQVKPCVSVAAEGKGQKPKDNLAPLDCPATKSQSSARLIAKRTTPKPGRRHVYLYDAEFGGELIVTDSANPACDFARAMHGRGYRGWIKVIDADSGMHRYSVNIEKLARLTVRETEREGPRFVRWKPFKRGDGSHKVGERGQS